MIRKYAGLALFLVLVCNTVDAQENDSQQLLFDQIYSAAEKEYGINQELINGPLFENRNQNAKRHPYFFDYYSNQGSVIYRGMQYSNLNLRYDIYAQELLLIYLYENVEYILHLQKEFVTEFQIENKKFTNEAFGVHKDEKFYQVIGEDHPIKLLYFWRKDLSNLYASNSDIKIFSSAQKDSFILMNNKLFGFNGNSAFARIFSPKPKTAIKKYFREKKIKVKLASDDEMELLMEFISGLAIYRNEDPISYE